MKIILTGGKTMGHISPLLALNERLKAKYEVVYIGLAHSMEEKWAQKNNISFLTIKAYPFYKKKFWKNIKTFYYLFREKKRLQKLFKQDVIAIYTTGGFVSIAPLLALKKQNINKILIESNTEKGLASRLISPYLTTVWYQFPVFNDRLGICKKMPIYYGNEYYMPKLYHQEDKILFVGGSNGAEEIIELAALFNQKYPHVLIFVLTGHKQNLFHFNDRAILLESIPSLVSVMKYFTLIISRSGGATISELIDTTSPNMLFPSKYVTNNHQVKNAQMMLSLKATKIITTIFDYDKIYALFMNKNELLDLKKGLTRLKTLYK